MAVSAGSGRRGLRGPAARAPLPWPARPARCMPPASRLPHAAPRLRAGGSDDGLPLQDAPLSDCTETIEGLELTGPTMSPAKSLSFRKVLSASSTPQRPRAPAVWPLWLLSVVTAPVFWLRDAPRHVLRVTESGRCAFRGSGRLPAAHGGPSEGEGLSALTVAFKRQNTLERALVLREEDL